jgi:CheY-like chemotaxis protein
MRGTPKRILVVDDDITERVMLAAELRRDGYEVIVAEDGEHALEMALLHKLDLVITDDRMPRGSGLQLIARMNDDPRLAAVPVILMTTQDVKPSSFPNRPSNVRHVVSKPSPYLVCHVAAEVMGVPDRSSENRAATQRIS